MKWIKIFLKYWLRYLLVLLMAIIFVIPVTIVSRNVIKDQIVYNTKNKLYEGCLGIDDELDKMNLITDILANDANMTKIGRIKGNLLPSQQTTLKYAYHTLREMSGVYSFSAYVCSLFPNNDIFISSKYCTSRFTDYYGKFLEIGADDFTTVETMKEWLKKIEKNRFFQKVNYVRYTQEGIKTEIKDAILAIEKNGKPSSWIIYVLEPEKLKDMLLTQDNTDGFVQIFDENSNAILLNDGITDMAFPDNYDDSTYEFDGRKYMVFSYHSPLSGLRTVLGVPEDNIDEKVQQITQMLMFYLLAGGCATLILAAYLSIRECNKVQKIYHVLEPEIPGGAIANNEYDFINHTINRIVKDKQSFKEQLEITDMQNKAICMESAFVRGIHSDYDMVSAKTAFGRIPDFYCVAVLKILVRQEDERRLAALAFTDLLKEYYPKHVISVHTGMDEEIFLIGLSPNDPSNTEHTCRIFEEIIKKLSPEIDGVYHVGISSVGSGFQNMNHCYMQARAVMEQFFQEDFSSVEYYTVNLNAARENIIDINYLEKLQSLILTSSPAAICAYFDKIKENCFKMPLQYNINKQQIFFAVRHVLYNVYMMTNTVPPDSLFLPEYHRDSTFEQLMDTLCGKAQLLNEENAKKNLRKKEEMKHQIVTYIHTHISDQDLDTAMVREEFGVSERYSNTAVKEITGLTFGAYREKVRIDMAKRLLMETDMTNEEIALACGFSAMNTFYNVFGKVVGCSPKAYKEKNSRK